MFDDFNYLDSSKWEKTNYSTPYTSYVPENVTVIDGNLICKAPANEFKGGELLTLKRFGYGKYRARLKISNIPNTVFSFYLYNHKGGNPDEIDVEFYGSNTHQINFNSWKDGYLVSAILDLTFDASADFHTYGFDYYKDRIDFIIDGVIVHTLNTNIPSTEMYMLCTAYSPSWMGAMPNSDGFLYIDWITQESKASLLGYAPVVIIGSIILGISIAKNKKVYISHNQ